MVVVSLWENVTRKSMLDAMGDIFSGWQKPNGGK